MSEITTRAAAGTGAADLPDSRAAGGAAAQRAVDAAGGGDADLALCFYHGRHDPQAVLDGVRDVLADTPIVGGAAPGVATNDYLGYESHQVGVAVLRGLAEPPTVAARSGLGDLGEAAVGAALGGELASQMRGPGDVLFFWSSIRRGMDHPQGASLYFGTPLVAGLLQALPAARTVAGCGTLGGLVPTASSVVGPGGADPHGAVAVGFGEALRMDTVVVHGCRPASSYHTITRTMGPVLLEIDGRPALDVIDELLGGQVRREDFPFRVILGVNHGDKFAAYDEESYQTRLCLAIDPPSGGLVMFEPDLEAGTEVQLMRPAANFEYVRDRVHTLLTRKGDRRPVFALYVDCMGRCAAAAGTDEEDAAVVASALGDVPYLACYSGVEVARVGGRVRPLDITGVLCLLSE